MNELFVRRENEWATEREYSPYTRQRDFGECFVRLKKVAEHIFSGLVDLTPPPPFNYTYFVEHSTTFFISKISATICKSSRAHPCFQNFGSLWPRGSWESFSKINWLLDRKCVSIVFRRKKHNQVQTKKTFIFK